MKITALYVYPIKGLRGIPLQQAHIGPQGIHHDRTFMLYEVRPDGTLKKVQVDSHPKCALFEQSFLSNTTNDAPVTITIRYHPSPNQTDAPEADPTILTVPLHPEISALQKVPVTLHDSPTTAYRMGDPFDTWFTARLDVPVILVYIGDGKRQVLGSTLPPPQPQPQQQSSTSWISSLASLVTPSQQTLKPTSWITFTDVAPLLITSESSLRSLCTRFPADQPVPMYKFRPNIVVDGADEEPWAEDYWAELSVEPADTEDSSSGHDGSRKLLLTGNCVRCTSLNVDYTTGKMAEGELGTVLKTLSRDRRVDKGAKWSPVFGRYAFLPVDKEQGITVEVGEEVQVTKRNSERTVWDWPGL